MQESYDHLPAAMTVADVAKELQLERHTAKKVIEKNMFHLHLSEKCIRVPRWSFLVFLGVTPSGGLERLRLPESPQG